MEGAHSGIDDIERAARERLDGIVDVGLDELGAEAGLGGEGTRLAHGFAREVEARDVSAKAGPRERVQSEVALEVEE